MEHSNSDYTGRDRHHQEWTDTFISDIKTRIHGDNLVALMAPKAAVAEMAANFAGEHMPPDALEVASIAHIAELAFHHQLGPNVRRSLHHAFASDMAGVSHEDWREDEEHSPLKYTFGLMRDFPVIADFIKAHEAENIRSGKAEYVDINGLVGLVEKVNFESIIIKSALDYSNFQYLDAKPELNEQELAKMRRTITAIKTVDSPLLALTGFDALEAVILSKAYMWELDQAGNNVFVRRSEEIFDGLGGRQSIAKSAEQLLDDLFAGDDYSHSRVTDDQERYEMFFNDGSVRLEGDTGEYRVLARLKSIGATAKKMHSLYNRTEVMETPMDIVGITLIAEDEDGMARCLEGLMKRLSGKDITYQAAPSRTEQVHVKGGVGFLRMFGSAGQHTNLYRNLSIKDEPCDKGYEAVKLTMSYNVDGKKIPVEIQITHEAARTQSRSGLSSHTKFKLEKLAKDASAVTMQNLSDSELLDRFQRIAVRKAKFDASSYETNGASTRRADALYKEVRDYAHTLGSIAISE